MSQFWNTILSYKKTEIYIRHFMYNLSESWNSQNSLQIYGKYTEDWRQNRKCLVKNTVLIYAILLLKMWTYADVHAYKACYNDVYVIIIISTWTLV